MDSKIRSDRLLKPSCNHRAHQYMTMKYGFTCNSIRTTAALLFIAALSGCAMGMVKYAPPVSGEMAKIRFINKANMNLDIAFYEISETCKNRRAINILTPGEQSLQTIPASRELTFQFMQASASSPSYCLRNVRFTPKAGGNYEFTASENIGQCVWSMVEQVEGKPQSVPFVDVGWKAGWDENGSFCKK